MKEACEDYIARYAAALDETFVVGAAVLVVIAFLALFWADEDADEERP